LQREGTAPGQLCAIVGAGAEAHTVSKPAWCESRSARTRSAARSAQRLSATAILKAHASVVNTEGVDAYCRNALVGAASRPAQGRPAFAEIQRAVRSDERDDIRLNRAEARSSSRLAPQRAHARADTQDARNLTSASRRFRSGRTGGSRVQRKGIEADLADGDSAPEIAFDVIHDVTPRPDAASSKEARRHRASSKPAMAEEPGSRSAQPRGPGLTSVAALTSRSARARGSCRPRRAVRDENSSPMCDTGARGDSLRPQARLRHRESASSSERSRSGSGQLVTRFHEPNDGTVAVSETRLPGARVTSRSRVAHGAAVLVAHRARGRQLPRARALRLVSPRLT